MNPQAVAGRRERQEESECKQCGRREQGGQSTQSRRSQRRDVARFRHMFCSVCLCLAPSAVYTMHTDRASKRERETEKRKGEEETNRSCIVQGHVRALRTSVAPTQSAQLPLLLLGAICPWGCCTLRDDDAPLDTGKMRRRCSKDTCTIYTMNTSFDLRIHIDIYGYILAII